MVSSSNELIEFIAAEKVLNVDIRFVDDEFKIKGFSFCASYLPKKIFETPEFNFNDMALLGVNFKRHCIDPFLPHKTLVFFTNLLTHKEKVQKLSESTEPHNNFMLDFYLKKPNVDFHAYEFAIPPFDSFRDLRGEIILSLKEMGVVVTSHFCGEEPLQNVLYIKSGNDLHLLDDIEKVKYAILMVASAYNYEVNLNKGIFKKRSLLDN